MLASDGFVPFHVLLAASPPCVLDEAPQSPAPVQAEAPARPYDGPVRDDITAALAEVRVFRARLADALADARERLTREIAYAVLGRELHLAPVDLGAIVARVLEEQAAAIPLCVRVAPADAGTFASPIPIVADATLAPGDAVLEFTGGFVDARLGVRVAAIVEAWS